eukprot:3772407-Prymnesium_polylepis.1
MGFTPTAEGTRQFIHSSSNLEKFHSSSNLEKGPSEDDGGGVCVCHAPNLGAAPSQQASSHLK